MYACEAFRWKRIATENVMFTELLIYIWYSLFSQMRGSGYSLWFGSCTIITKITVTSYVEQNFLIF